MNYHYRHITGRGKPSLVDLSIGMAGGQTLRVLESPLADRAALRDAILTRRYAKPFIGENRNARALYFTLDSVQSRMRLDDPWALDLLYTRKAMSFLLFQADSADILLLGLGGGSLAKYCHRNLPGARIDAVEIDANVIALGAYFCMPAASPRFAIIRDDAARYVEASPRMYDAIVADAFDGGGLAPSLRAAGFYENARSRLRAEGLLVVNLAGPPAERRDHLARLSSAFEGNVLLVPVECEGNEIALAFNSGRVIDWAAIHRRAVALRHGHGLDFARFAGRFERSCKLGYLRRALSA